MHHFCHSKDLEQIDDSKQGFHGQTLTPWYQHIQTA